MRITGLILLFGTLAVAACGDNDNNFVPIQPLGTFTLQSVNGQTLPATIVDSVSPPLRVDVLSGSITFNADGTFSEFASLQSTIGGIVSQRSVTCTGTFSFAGTTLNFVGVVVTQDCGGTFVGTLNNGTLTASILGRPAVFVR